MDRQDYLNLAASGLRMPIGADLVLHEQSDPEAIMHDGERLGRVLLETAERFQTPLALSRMDLELEKSELLGMLEVSQSELGPWHFDSAPNEALMRQIDDGLSRPFGPRFAAHVAALRHVATNSDRVPVGMAIGPFSFAAKLLTDPITPVALAGMGLTAEDEPEVAGFEQVLAIGQKLIERSLTAQMRAGAKMICICEPAANTVYLSPKQLEQGSNAFERYVIGPNLAIKRQLEASGVELMFHDCGELIDAFVAAFATRLDPAILSLGSSRVLWEDARLVPQRVVMFGNVPSKRFYSDREITVEQIEAMSCELIDKMHAAGQPFILATECDVLSVPDCHETIAAKVQAMLSSDCESASYGGEVSQS